MAAFTACNLVNLIEENDAGIFDPVNGDAGDLIHVYQPLLFFLDQILEGLIDLHFALLGALAEDVGQHVFDVDVHLLDALIGDDFERGEIAFADVNLNRAVVEFAFAQLLAQLFAAAGGGIARTAFEDNPSARSLPRTRGRG